MLIRLQRRYKSSPPKFSDYEIVDVLRALSQHDRDSIISRTWLVQELDFFAYNDDFKFDRFQFLFPEQGLEEGTEEVLVSGERLLERSALIHILESGLFLRVVDTNLEVQVDAEYRLAGGPPRFQATNVDLELRSYESPMEVVTEDEHVIAHLQWAFEVTEVVH